MYKADNKYTEKAMKEPKDNTVEKIISSSEAKIPKHKKNKYNLM